MLDYKTFGKNVKQYRELLNMTSRQLADKAEISYDNMSRLENGKLSIGMSTIVKLANALYVGVDELLDINCGSTNNVLVESIKNDLKAFDNTQKNFILEMVKIIKVSD